MTKKPSKLEVDQAVIMNELGHIKTAITDMGQAIKEHVVSSDKYRQQTTVNSKSIGWIWATVGLIIAALGGMVAFFIEHLTGIQP